MRAQRQEPLQPSGGDDASFVRQNSLDISSGPEALWEDFRAGNGAERGRDGSAGTEITHKSKKPYQACLACSRDRKVRSLLALMVQKYRC
jgi:hypothetical protein